MTKQSKHIQVRETKMTEITKELEAVLHHIRRVIDDGNGNLVYFGTPTKVRIDAILERYEEFCKTPEPIINRVEIITHDGGRVYVNWEKDNRITTSLQDDGRTLKIFVNKTTEEPEMPTKLEFTIEPELIEDLWSTTANYRTFANDVAEMMVSSTKVKVSNQWATALSNLIDELGGDGPALWDWKGITPTPERVVEYLREHIKYLEQIAANNELEECCNLKSIPE